MASLDEAFNIDNAIDENGNYRCPFCLNKDVAITYDGGQSIYCPKCKNKSIKKEFHRTNYI